MTDDRAPEPCAGSGTAAQPRRFGLPLLLVPAAVRRRPAAASAIRRSTWVTLTVAGLAMGMMIFSWRRA